MGKKRGKPALRVFLVCLLFLMPGSHAAASGIDQPSRLPADKCLAQGTLAHYNDSFDRLREDIWEKAQLPYPGKTSRMPDIAIESGKLRISTKTGDFCKGGLGSRYALKGDFDIQVDCHMDFLERASGMDQVLIFVVQEKRWGEFVSIGLVKKPNRRPAVYSVHYGRGKPSIRPEWDRIGNFQGTLRIARTGERVSTFYRKEGESGWKGLLVFRGLTGEVRVGLELKNFITKRASIRAESPVVAKFDNFRINAAQEIIEGETVSSFPSKSCDMAPHFFWKAKFDSQQERALKFYMEAIGLCPGYIRPYELIGNIYRKKGETEKAIEFFTKAAQLGTRNYKLYYLLASLLFEREDLDEASRHLKKSLSIRSDYPKALKLKEEIERASDQDGPKIILYEPAARRGIKIVHPHENLTVRGIALDKSGIAWVKVNQLDTSVDEQGNFLKDISIKRGANMITIEAVDRLGNQSSISVTVEGEEYVIPVFSRISALDQANKLYGKSFAVIVGINHYDKWPPLEFAVNDAKEIRRKLEETGFDEITTILDKEATQRRLLTELFYTLPQKVGRNDRVLFYFAGHGQTEETPNGRKRGYIIPSDADVSNCAATAISMEQIRDLSTRIRAKHILYVMDSCYSGLGLSRSYGVSPKISDYIRKVSSMRVVQIVTAGGKGEQVQEKGGHGLFTTYLLKALDGEADYNRDNFVTGTELGAYLRPSVSNASNQAQTPLYGRLEGEGEFLFYVGKK